MSDSEDDFGDFEDHRELDIANLEELRNAIDEILPLTQDTKVEEPGPLLSETAHELYGQLFVPPHITPLTVKNSFIHAQLLSTLGVTVETSVVEEAEPPRHIDTELFSELVREASAAKPNNDESVLDVDVNDLSYDQVWREIRRVQSLIKYYLDEIAVAKEEMDTFGSVLNNLTGHTQKLRIEEAKKNAKKDKRRSFFR